MCSHDGCMFNAQNVRYLLQLNDEDRFVSFLPMNHIAAQYVDTMIPVANRITMYLARPDALRGSLVATLRKARPTFFVAVPRVYEKFMEAIRAKNAQAPVSPVIVGIITIVLETVFDLLDRVHWSQCLQNTSIWSNLLSSLFLQFC